MYQLRASSASRRLMCPGSKALEEEIAKIRPPYRNVEHETARWAALELLKGNEVKIGQFSPDLELITAEMIECGNYFRDYVMNIIFSSPLKTQILIDEQVTVSAGYVDTIDVIYKEHSKIQIFKYHYGHSFMDCFENYEMLSYASAIWQPGDSVKFHIIQPRCYQSSKMSTWWVSDTQILFYFDNLKQGEKKAFLLKDQIPSKECSRCTARSICPTLSQTADISAGIAVDSLNYSQDLSLPELGNELRYLKQAQTLLNSRISGLEIEVESKLKNGFSVPYFRLENTGGKQVWKLSPEEIISTCDILNVNVRKSLDVITPKQAIKAGLDRNVVELLSEIREGSIKLIQYETNEGRKIFEESC